MKAASLFGFCPCCDTSTDNVRLLKRSACGWCIMVYNSAAAEQIVQYLVSTVSWSFRLKDVIFKQVLHGKPSDNRDFKSLTKEQNHLQKARGFSGIHRYQFYVQSEWCWHKSWTLYWIHLIWIQKADSTLIHHAVTKLTQCLRCKNGSWTTSRHF